MRGEKVVDPNLRPIKRRQAARVLVVAEGTVLLEADSDPGIPGSGWYVTPGGGIDEGEDAVTAAVREMKEETGLDVEPHQLVGPIAKRLVKHGYSDRILIQEEFFYRLDLEAKFTPSDAGFTEDEKESVKGFAWLTPGQIAGTVVWPARLLELYDAEPSALLNDVLDLGEEEESTIPM